MRVQPKPIIGIGAFLLYVALVFGLGKAVGPDFTELADSVENLLWGVYVPVGAAALGMVVLTTWLGWWRPAIKDRHRAPAWIIIAPLLMVAIAVSNMLGADFGMLSTSYLLVLAGGMLLVGLGEELMSRGLLLTAMRGRSNEFLAWLVSTVLFGVMHIGNFFMGQDLVPTLGQVGLTMIFGTGFYIIRRATGSLIWAMLLHALWDFGSFVNTQAGEQSQATQLMLAALPIVVIVCLIWAIKGAKERLDAAPESAPVTG